MADGPVFPAFLKLEYQRDNSAKDTFLAEMASITTDAQRNFKQSFDEIGNVVKRSLSGFRSGEFRIDLDTSTLRQAAADAEFAASRLTFTRDAATRLAAATGDTSQATQTYLQALRAQTIEAERNAGAAREQVTTYSRLQAEIDRTIGKNQQLAASFRATFEEQAKAANYAHAYQQGINQVFAPGLSGPAKSARSSASVFEEQSYPSRAGTSSGLDRMLAGSASLDRAAVSATTLEQVLGRVSNKGREVAAALTDAAQQSARSAEEEATRVAAARRSEEIATAGAADAARRYAAEANELRQRLDPSLAAQQRFDAELARADELMAAGAISAREYAQAQLLATAGLQDAWQKLTAAERENAVVKRQGASEAANVVSGIRAQRVAFIQLGQQMQDVVVQTQMGTSATTVFVQQVPQMAYALSGLAGNANKTYARIGQFATFMAGPWGAAIFAATAILGPFVAKLFESGEAADAAKSGANALAEAQSALGGIFDSVSGRIKSQNELLVLNARLTAINLRADALTKRTSSTETLARSGQQSFSDRALSSLAMDVDVGPSTGETNTGAISKLLAGVRQGKISREDALRRSENLDFKGVAVTKVEFQQAVIDAATADLNEKAASLIDKSLNDGSLAPSLREAGKSKKPKADHSAEKAAREAERLAQFGDRAAESIQRINERFNEQPRLVDQAAQSTRQLDDLIADLEKRKPAGFQAMIDEATAAKQTIQDALVRPFQELERNSERRVQLQQLLSQGRDAEANALQEIWRKEADLGPLTSERRAEVLRIAQAEQKQVEALQRAQEVQQAYLDTTRSIRSAVEGILGGYGKLSDLKNIGQQLRGKALTENLFGDVFRDMDKWVKEKTGIGSSVDMLAKETDRAGSAAGQFADTIIAATNRLAAINSPSSPTSTDVGPVWDLKSISIPALLAAPKSTPVAANENPPIIVNGKVPGRPGKTVNDLTPERYFEEQKNKMRDALTSSLEKAGLGSGLAKTLASPIAGALEGYMTTGTGFGAVLGGLKDLKGLPDGLSAAFGKAFGGAQTGSQVAGIGNAIGIKMNQTGAEIGGAIGSLVPIPGGQVIGSVVGGLLGNLFGKRPRGGGAVSQDSINVSANDGGITSSLDSFGGALQNSITKIADALGGSVGSYDVGIGRYKEYYQVSGVGNDKALGNSYFQNRSSTALYDGTDAEAAMRAAILGAINDGAVKGIREGSIRLLKAGKDLDAQIQKAVDFQNVFKKLKSYTDPVGAALDTLDSEFSKLKQTFTEAGASAQEFADLQKLYGIERTNAVKQAMDQITGSLQSLMNDLTIGNDALSLRDRKAAALAVYQPLEDRVKAGDTTAYSDFADAAQQLLDIQHQMSGSQSDYFALLDEVKSITQTQLDSAKSVANASANRDNPFSSPSTTGAVNDNSGVATAIDNMSAKLADALGFKLDAVNQNLGSVIKNLASLVEQGTTGTASTPSYNRLLSTGSW